MKEKNIDSIQRLSSIQQALLIHNLNSEVDQGLIVVTANLSGELNKQAFASAWQAVVAKYEALRSTIHWEKLKQPVQVVHSTVDTSVDFHELPLGHDHEEWINEEHGKAFDLSSAPVWRIAVLQVSEISHQLVWAMHHILLDGWSSHLVLKELLHFYDEIVRDQVLASTPDTSFTEFLKVRGRGPSKVSLDYWKAYLQGFGEASLIASTQGVNRKIGEPFQEVVFNIKSSEKVKAKARSFQTSLNTLLKGLWSLILSRYLRTDDFMMGVTVSGRESGDFERTVGMLMNVLPFRSKVVNGAPLADYFKQLTLQEASRMGHEHMDLDDIVRQMDATLDDKLFDIVFIFENFAQDQIAGGSIRLSDFRSGLTSTYPLTIVVIPGKTLQLILRYDIQKVDTLAVDTLRKAFESAVELLLSANRATASDIQQCISPRVEVNGPKEEAEKSLYKRSLIFRRNRHGSQDSILAKRSMELDDYVAPSNTTELMLSHLWEDLFDFTPIGTHDDFFALGGTSMMAVRLFAQIEKNVGQKLPPTTLLQHRTIASLAMQLLASGESTWTTIVPLRVGGDGQPLFCLHAGGAHVFFYHDLAKIVGDNRPIYAIQPIGLESQEKSHTTLEDMASHYLEEIQKIQANGPYALLGTCFSDALAFEMAHQLNAAGSSATPLIIVDAQPTGRKRREASTQEKVKWNVELLIKGDFSMLFRRIKTRVMNVFGEGDRWELGQHDRFHGNDQLQLESLEKLRKQLSSLYEEYNWKPYEGAVDYIHSDDFGGGTRIKINQEMWREVAKGELRTHRVKGNHFTLFEHPDVRHLALAVSTIMASHDLEPSEV
ncbi:MAG: condensation domain-containing protein [Bacteroidota bacterium]